MSPAPMSAVITVVDDVPANVKLLGEILRLNGYRVLTFTDGARALEAATAAPPDLFLLDVSMPGLDGYAVCERLKADERLAGIPVLFISALGEALDKVRAFRAGGVDYITKPFEIEEVLARVATHLGLRRVQAELEGRNAELVRSIARTREVEALRDSLVHMIVHDVRNPLVAISGFLSLIREGEEGRLSAAGREYVERTIRSAEALTELISTVLDVSKLESERMQLNRERCDLGAIAADAVSRLEALKGRGRIELSLPEQPAEVAGDGPLLSRVLQNLVGNALAFAGGGEGRVVVEVRREASGARVAVRDNGPGIPPEYRERIFDKFWQGAARRQGYSASTGLGLTFCKMAVEAHGGRIGVDSEPGKGSTFWFEIPRGEITEQVPGS